MTLDATGARKLSGCLGPKVKFEDYKVSEDGVEYYLRVFADGRKEWYDPEGYSPDCSYNELHRLGDKPAVIYPNGDQEWWQEGRQHRDGDKPAAIYADGTLEWYQDSHLCRADGKPAIVHPDGTEEFYSCSSYNNEDIGARYSGMYYRSYNYGDMHVHYSDDPICEVKNSHSIFLAGPTPRSKSVPSWRPQALEVLKAFNYTGFVWVPEHKGGCDDVDYIGQVEWEKWGLESATKIVFWVPRDLKDMPAFTTNVEFGRYIDSGRVVYGRPDTAEKCSYLDWLYKDTTGCDHHNRLGELLIDAMDVEKR
jgi:hypothetical protein